MPSYLVAGGAGFIGSHLVKSLRNQGHDVVVIDNLRQGHRAAVPRDVPLMQIDLADRDKIEDVFAQQRFDAVFHFAALSLVGESMRDPLRYCQENLSNTLNLARAAINSGCLRMVFSSTAALFCPPADGRPIASDARPDPQNAYGESKWIVERSLAWAEQSHGLHTGSLRYFNAAGCDSEGELGEDHAPETHLIPLAVDAALGLRPPLQVFGTDYPTRDGTAIRDYIHVEDLVAAHIAVLPLLEAGSCQYNLGTGHGSSVMEVLNAVARVAGRPVPATDSPRRAGDPTVLVAESSAFQADTGWFPRYTCLDDIVATAWNWRNRHPEGYRSDVLEAIALPLLASKPGLPTIISTQSAGGIDPLWCTS